MPETLGLTATGAASHGMFRLYRLRFTCVALGRDRVFFPPGKAANVLRGALGMTLRDLCCDPASCESARTCPRRTSCGYARIFEPVLEEGPSGMHDPPRPFVLRAAELDGQTFAPGVPFRFDIHLFLVEDPPVAQLVEALSQLADSGLGPARGRVRINCVELLDARDVPEARLAVENGRIAATVLPPPIAIPFGTAPGGNTEERLVVDFLSPTELKQEGRVLDKPLFPALLARIRDRLGSLSTLYGTPLALDWKGLGERAQAIVLERWDPQALAQVARFSSKTRQTHSLGGFAGRATYGGPFGEFLPLLQAAEFAGVGRQTVWGKGHIRVVSPR